MSSSKNIFKNDGINKNELNSNTLSNTKNILWKKNLLNETTSVQVDSWQNFDGETIARV